MKKSKRPAIRPNDQKNDFQRPLAVSPYARRLTAVQQQPSSEFIFLNYSWPLADEFGKDFNQKLWAKLNHFCIKFRVATVKNITFCNNFSSLLSKLFSSILSPPLFAFLSSNNGQIYIMSASWDHEIIREIVIYFKQTGPPTVADEDDEEDEVPTPSSSYSLCFSSSSS